MIKQKINLPIRICCVLLPFFHISRHTEPSRVNETSIYPNIIYSVLFLLTPMQTKVALKICDRLMLYSLFHSASSILSQCYAMMTLPPGHYHNEPDYGLHRTSHPWPSVTYSLYANDFSPTLTNEMDQLALVIGLWYHKPFPLLFLLTSW